MAEDGRMNGAQALQALMEGNGRFVSASLNHPDQSPKRRVDIAKAQHPFAAILSCSDSQAPPEIIFDQGLGSLFVTRVAGHIVDESVLGSLEYAVEYLGVPLIMVMGHKRCGLVDEASNRGEVGGHICSLVESIGRAVRRVKGMPGDPLDNAIKANIEMVVEQLRASKPLIAERVKKNELRIVGANYDLDTGKVDIIHL